MLSPGEGVLTPGAVQAIGPGTVHALNRAYPPAGYSEGGTIGYAAGGILSGIGSITSSVLSSLGSALSSIAGGAVSTAELLTNPTGFITSLLDAKVSTSAAGDLGQMMTSVPKTLIGDLAKGLGTALAKLAATVTSGKGGAAGTPGAGVEQWRADVLKALAMLGLPASLANAVLYQMQTESGGNPLITNTTDINAQEGHPSTGLMQVIPSTFAAYHVAGTSNNINDPLANIAAAINYAEHVYGPTLMNSAGMGIGSGHGYDGGGWLQPSTAPINTTGRPEAVLTPEESQAFITMAKHFTQQAEGGGGQPVVVNFNGTTYPNVEQMAAIKRELALAAGPA